MAHNLNNIVVDRVLRGVFADKNDNVIFSLNQVQDLSMNQTSESQEVTDALGVSIMELMRSKALEVSANNAIYDFGLLASQYGTEKVEVGTTVIAPVMKTFTLTEGSYTLKPAPVEGTEIKTVYELNGDSTLGAKYEVGTDFSYADGKITMTADVDANAEFFVMYEHETESAIEIVNSANNFAKMGKMTFEVLAYDVCDPETKLFGYLILPRFQLSNDFDWSIGGDNQQHAFSGKAHVDYCAKDKEMCRIVIVDEDEE